MRDPMFRQPGARRRAVRGFTLMELIVAVAVLGILATIAISSYSEYVNRARRSEGRQALLDALQAMERFYTANNRFTAFDPTSPNGFRTYSGDNSQVSHYVLSAAACSGVAASACVVISAVPSGQAVPPSGSRFTDAQCGALTVTTGGARAPANCW